MSWDDGLLPEQKAAAVHTGTHARLLAGPGTGKTRTLTHHICFLIAERNASPDSVLAITFTRAATRELRQRVADELGGDRSPRISTLHSFALRQLLKNSAKTSNLPQPLRIADDWEEQKIVLRDLKSLLNLKG
jgi:DNA helicase-2/ATP-dependent DNA helicase PcrA